MLSLTQGVLWEFRQRRHCHRYPLTTAHSVHQLQRSSHRPSRRHWIGSPSTPDCLFSLHTPGSHSPWLVCVYMCPLFLIVLADYCPHVHWSCTLLYWLSRYMLLCTCYYRSRPVYYLEVYNSLFCLGYIPVLYIYVFVLSFVPVVFMTYFILGGEIKKTITYSCACVPIIIQGDRH
jgi:hypothetical protein